MPRSIMDTASEAGAFHTPLAAVDAAGLGDTLADGGPLTVFAPTDEAFATLPETVSGLLADPPALARVLTDQVLPCRITSAQITNDREQKTVEGGVLELAVNGGMSVNDATVIQADAEADGVIHVID
jgi:uncharacterized surface protein with fasciclin (FAS1) repeats